jgi:hypothetical protein
LKKKIYVIFLDLIRISQPTHTAHHSKNVVVHGVYLDGVGGVYALEVKGSVVNARHVAGSGRLVFLGLEGEGIHVNHTSGAGGGHDGGTVGVICSINRRGAHSGHALVVLVGLHKLEILGTTLGETFMPVKLELGGIVGGFVGAHCGGRGILLHPHEFLHGVIEVELDLGGSGFVTGELELFNEVFVGHLGETATLVSVKVDVINVEGGGVNGSAGTGGTHNI